MCLAERTSVLSKGVKMGSFIDGVKSILQYGANTAMTKKEFLEAEIKRWKGSDRRKTQIVSDNYYMGNHDILEYKRQVIGEDGELVEVENLPNNLIVDNQYALRVDQKTNYLVGKPITIKVKNDAYNKALKGIFNKAFNRKFKSICTSCLNGGAAYLYPYYGADEIKFKVFSSYEVLPFWKDSEHTELDSFIRLYQIEGYEGQKPIIIEKIEYYTSKGIEYFVLETGKLRNDNERENTSYIQVIGKDKTELYNWQKIPLILFRYNPQEITLLSKVKSLQDGINKMLSTYQNNMEEDARNTILVLVNYDGQNLGEFRRNLAMYGAVKVTNNGAGAGGDLKTLQVEVNSENYKTIVELFKKALIENAKGYDSKDERLQGSPNQMNIQSMYSDIDLDANGMETEFQAALEELLWFVNAHLSHIGKGDFENEEVEFIFNRDVPVNTSNLITDINNSVDLLSVETLLAKHPFVTDPKEEMKRKKKEQMEQENPYDDEKAFVKSPVKGDDDG